MEDRTLPSGSGPWQPVVPVLQLVNGQYTMVGKQHLPPVGSTSDDVWLGSHLTLHQISWRARVAADTDPAATQAALTAIGVKDDRLGSKAEAKAAGIQWAAWLSRGTTEAGDPTGAEVKKALGKLATKTEGESRDLLREATDAAEKYTELKASGAKLSDELKALYKFIDKSAQAQEAFKFSTEVAKLTKLPDTEVKAAAKQLVDKQEKVFQKMKEVVRKDKDALERAKADPGTSADTIIKLTVKLTKSVAAAERVASDLRELAKALK